MKKIPFILLYSRLIMAALNIVVAILYSDQAYALVSALIILALLTDIFDGITARALGVSSEKMRALDSKIDTVFWISVLFTLIILRSNFIRSHLFFIGVLIISEIICQLYAHIKFKKGLALHAYIAKVWAILIGATCIQILSAPENDKLFFVLFFWGLLAQLETLLIITILPKWHSDVPGLWQAIQLRKNKTIKRYKLFNG